jgi:uncharacterized protein HemY
LDTYLPNEPDLLRLLARCAEQRGDWSAAADYLRRARVIEPHDTSTELALQAVLSRQSTELEDGEARP